MYLAWRESPRAYLWGDEPTIWAGQSDATRHPGPYNGLEGQVLVLCTERENSAPPVPPLFSPLQSVDLLTPSVLRESQGMDLKSKPLDYMGLQIGEENGIALL